MSNTGGDRVSINMLAVGHRMMMAKTWLPNHQKDQMSVRKRTEASAMIRHTL